MSDGERIDSNPSGEKTGETSPGRSQEIGKEAYREALINYYEKSIGELEELLRKIKEREQKTTDEINGLKHSGKEVDDARNTEVDGARNTVVDDARNTVVNGAREDAPPDSGNTPPGDGEDAPTDSEKISPEEINEKAEKTKTKKGWKKFIIPIITFVAGAAVTAGLFIGFAPKNNEKQSDGTIGSNIESASDVDMDQKYDDALANMGVETEKGIDETENDVEKKLLQLIDGSFEQDGNIGCFEDNNKIDDYSVGNPRAIAEYLGLDYDTLTPEQRGKISEYINMSMKYPAASLGITHKYPSFDGLSQIGAEDKLAKMSQEEKMEYLNFLKNEFKNSTYSTEEGKGVMLNHGIIEDENGRHSINSETDLTGVKILVRTTTREDGTKIVDYEKDDCANWLYTIVYHSDGGVEFIYPPTDANNPPSETPPSETPPNNPDNPDPDPKNQAEADKNSGASEGIVTPEDQNREITSEPIVDEDYQYNPDTNTYDYTSAELDAQIPYEGESIIYEVKNDIEEAQPGSTPVGTTEGATGESGQANDFNAGATEGTGEVSGDTQSAGGSGNTTVEETLDGAENGVQVNRGL